MSETNETPTPRTRTPRLDALDAQWEAFDPSNPNGIRPQQYRDLCIDIELELSGVTEELAEAREQLNNHCACQHDGRGNLTSECDEHQRLRTELAASREVLARVLEWCEMDDPNFELDADAIRRVLHPEGGHVQAVWVGTMDQPGKTYDVEEGK